VQHKPLHIKYILYEEACVACCGSITPCDSLKPTTPTTAIDKSNDPLTTTSSTSVVFAMEKVTFVSFNDNRLTISISSSKKGVVVQQPRVALLVEVIITIDNCVPAANTLKEHYVLAF